MGFKIEQWIEAQKRHRLSDKHIQITRELELNPTKLGKIDNHKQEARKAPLPQFIEEIYFKRFKREAPLVVKSLSDQLKEERIKREKRKREKTKKCVEKAATQTDTIVSSVSEHTEE